MDGLRPQLTASRTRRGARLAGASFALALAGSIGVFALASPAQPVTPLAAAQASPATRTPGSHVAARGLTQLMPAAVGRA